MPHTHYINNLEELKIPFTIKRINLSTGAKSIFINQYLINNQIFYSFNSQFFKPEKSYIVFKLNLQIPQSFNLDNTSGNLTFIFNTNIPNENQHEPYQFMILTGNGSTCSDHLIAYYNKDIERFEYNNNFYIPFIGFRDDPSNSKPEIQNNLYLFYYKLSGDEFTQIFSDLSKFNYTTQWAFYDDIQIEIINGEEILFHRAGSIV